MTKDLNWMRTRPFAHRGLHDSNVDVCENSLSACDLAIKNGYNIEIDLHPASDGTPMIFHDLTLKRLCNDDRHIRNMTQAELAQVELGTTQDHIPTLLELLNLTDCKVGLVLELKGLLGEDAGFVAAISETLQHYEGDVAIMSFNHWLLEDTRNDAPHLPLGLTAEGNDKFYDVHQQIADKCDVDFISYNLKDMPSRFTTQFAGTEKPVLTWTIRDEVQFRRALELGTIPTFEGFKP